MKNGIVVPIGLVGMLALGLIGYGTTQGQVKANKEEIVETKQEHKDDVKDINGKLSSILDITQKNALNNGKIQATLEFIKEDIKEIKNK